MAHIMKPITTNICFFLIAMSVHGFKNHVLNLLPFYYTHKSSYALISVFKATKKLVFFPILRDIHTINVYCCMEVIFNYGTICNEMFKAT